MLNKKKQLLALQLFFNVMLKWYNNMPPLRITEDREKQQLQTIIDEWLGGKPIAEEGDCECIFNLWMEELEKHKINKQVNKNQLEREFNWLWLNYSPKLKNNESDVL